MTLVTLTKRADFLAAARAGRVHGEAFSLQGRRRGDTEDVDPHSVRVGYTCSKKVGNAVARNRAKRRLRALTREVLPDCAEPGWDYVLIGRPKVTAEAPFDTLREALRRAVTKVHSKQRPR